MTTKDTYIEGIGRRKTATARVRLTPSKKGEFLVNDKSLAEYFALDRVANTAKEGLENFENKFSVSVHVKGGGIKAQAEAIRLGISRALIKDEPELRTEIKKKGFLKRDPRMKERKKFGLLKARRRPQWSKR